jgi:hypothetical protein
MLNWHFSCLKIVNVPRASEAALDIVGQESGSVSHSPSITDPPLPWKRLQVRGWGRPPLVAVWARRAARREACASRAWWQRRRGFQCMTGHSKVSMRQHERSRPLGCKRGSSGRRYLASMRSCIQMQNPSAIQKRKEKERERERTPCPAGPPAAG